nr:uncharacterized protein LOC125418441 [Ziziphus jujuba var. spinosa]
MVVSQLCVHGCGCRETDSHLFFHCQVAKAIWFATPWSIKWDSLENLSLEEKLLVLTNPTGVLLVHSDDKEEFFLFATLILEQLWKIRNLVIFENKSFSLDDVLFRLKIRFQEAKFAANFCSGTHNMLHSRPARRTPPLQCIKINTDAAIRDGSSMVAVIARDQKGCLLKIKAVQCNSDIPEVAEAFGVLQGLLLAQEEGWNNLWCESDARMLVQSLNNPERHISHWAAAGFIFDILRLLKDFQEVHFAWIPRKENILADFVCSWCLKHNISGFLSQSSLPSSFSAFVTTRRSVACSYLPVPFCVSWVFWFV